jgi:hypothetical protein
MACHVKLHASSDTDRSFFPCHTVGGSREGGGNHLCPPSIHSSPVPSRLSYILKGCDTSDSTS